MLPFSGLTSKQWREEHPDNVLDGLNIRDLATIPQLTVLANLESYNSILIKEGVQPKERLEKLKVIAVSQLRAINQYQYTYPKESPHKIKSEQGSSIDKDLKGLIKTPPLKEPPKIREDDDITPI